LRATPHGLFAAPKVYTSFSTFFEGQGRSPGSQRFSSRSPFGAKRRLSSLLARTSWETTLFFAESKCKRRYLRGTAEGVRGCMLIGNNQQPNCNEQPNCWLQSARQGVVREVGLVLNVTHDAAGKKVALVRREGVERLEHCAHLL